MTLYYHRTGVPRKGGVCSGSSTLLKIQKRKPEFADIYYHLGSVYGRTGQKGLSHFYFGKHFKLKREKNNALLHFRTAMTGWKEEARRERKPKER